MTVPLQNYLSVKLERNQSHGELLSYIQAKQKYGPIRQLNCCIYGRHEVFSVQHPLVSFCQSTPSLEHVAFICWDENVSIDAFLDAVSQNESIHTVILRRVDCSASVVQKLLERKIRWELESCRFIGHPSNRDEYTCNVEELKLDVTYGDSSVIDFMSNFRSWTFLRRLSIWGIRQNLQVEENFIRGAPVLQQLTLRYYDFCDPAMLHSFATVIRNASSADLRLHLDQCTFHLNTMGILEKIVTWEKAKSMRVSLDMSRDHCKVLRTILSDSSCLGYLDVNYNSMQHDDFVLQGILQALQEPPFPSAYPLTAVKLLMNSTYLERYHEFIESIPQ